MAMSTDHWQPQAIERLTSLLAANDDVLALVLFGSSAHVPEKQDFSSDVDVMVVVRDHTRNRFCATLDWLAPLGEIFAYEYQEDPFAHTIRICLSDFHRFDFVVTAEWELVRVDEWPSVAFWQHRRVLFSRSVVVDSILRKRLGPPTSPLISAEQFAVLVNQFWFKAVTIVNKVMRNDLLSALHLCRDLIQDCLVVAMLLRDRDLVHRREGIDWNDVAGGLASTPLLPTPSGILDSVEQSIVVYDNLAQQWSAAHRERSGPFRAWLDHARRALDESNR
jgi:predicted nucleotidyltransferase